MTTAFGPREKIASRVRCDSRRKIVLEQNVSKEMLDFYTVSRGEGMKGRMSGTMSGMTDGMEYRQGRDGC